MKHLPRNCRYFRIDDDYIFEPINTSEVSREEVEKQEIPESYFGLTHDPKRYKVGRRVIVTSIRTGYQQYGEITVTQRGIPIEIKTDSGDWIPIFGIIIEILPLIERLINAIKELFKKK